MRAFVLAIAALLLGGSLALLPPAVHPDAETRDATATGSWRAEVVTRHTGHAHPRIALDRADRPHVLQCDAESVRYGIRTDTGWRFEPVVDTERDVSCGDLALGAQDEAHMYERETRGLGPVYGTRVGGAWRFVPLGLAGGWEAEFAVDSAGALHAVSIDVPAAEGLLATVSFATLRDAPPGGAEWDVEAVDAFPFDAVVALWSVLAFDLADRPHVLFYAHGGGIRYAVRDGGAWHVEPVEDIGRLLENPELEPSSAYASIVVAGDGTVHATYMSVNHGLRYASRSGGSWSLEIIDGPPTKPSFPGLVLAADGTPSVGYATRGLRTQDHELLYATRTGGVWTVERVHDPRAGTIFAPFAPSFRVDSCGNPHVVANARIADALTDLWYATKGDPCGPPPPPTTREVWFDVNPNTMNLGSRGRWVMARLRAVNGTVADIDAATLRLNDVPVAWWTEPGNGTLIAKFDRGALHATLSVGDRVEVVLTGAWLDGEPLRAVDHVRVIDPPAHKP